MEETGISALPEKDTMKHSRQVKVRGGGVCDNFRLRVTTDDRNPLGRSCA